VEIEKRIFIKTRMFPSENEGEREGLCALQMELRLCSSGMNTKVLSLMGLKRSREIEPGILWEKSTKKSSVEVLMVV
jgi:hypothetical protein